MTRLGFGLAVSLMVQSISPVFAQEKLGSVTNLPLPRFVSMKAPEANARRGPSKTHKIDWKFVRRHLPLMVTAEHGHWRRVQDHEGQGGWVHYALLSRSRTVLVLRDDMEMFAKPKGLSRLVAKVNSGVVGKFGGCDEELCLISTEGKDGMSYEGWVARSALWGLKEDD